MKEMLCTSIAEWLWKWNIYFWTFECLYTFFIRLIVDKTIFHNIMRNCSIHFCSCSLKILFWMGGFFHPTSFCLNLVTNYHLWNPKPELTFFYFLINFYNAFIIYFFDSHVQVHKSAGFYVLTRWKNYCLKSWCRVDKVCKSRYWHIDMHSCHVRGWNYFYD